MPVYEDTEPASLVQRPIGENPQPVSLNEQVFTACQIARESDLNMSLRSTAVPLLPV